MTNELDKEKFTEIFNKCMKVNTTVCAYEDGSCDEVDIDACISIVDFEDDVSNMVESGIWTDNALTFTDLDKAWAYFQTLELYRIKDGAGFIHADTYEV